jgi:hypothetical protein
VIGYSRSIPKRYVFLPDPRGGQVATIEPFFFAPEKLSDLAARARRDYREAVPFPHFVFDNFLPDEVLESVLHEFPPPNDSSWRRFASSDQQWKLATRYPERLGSHTRLLLAQFNSATFVDFLEGLTGIQGLVPDPHYYGGGLHQIDRGGYLKVHVDFNWHERMRLDRRINVLVYLNRDWLDQYGGHLELWKQGASQPSVRILPIFNRCVVFNTTSLSLHGHPDPLTCPVGISRRSIALYYYTNGRPSRELEVIHSTLFRPRPGETWKRQRSRRWLEQVTPPIVAQAARRWHRHRHGADDQA